MEKFKRAVFGENRGEKVAAKKDEECKTPGKKLKSKGKGRGLAKGKGKGPMGIPVVEKIKTAEDAYRAGVLLGLHTKLGQGPALAAGPAVLPSVQQMVPQATQPARQVPMGMEQIPGASPGSYQNPQWQRQALPFQNLTPASKLQT